jgi:hypothetical protein
MYAHRTIVPAPSAVTPVVQERPVWPSEKGEYIASSSDGIPPFPQQVSEYAYEAGDKDFWGHPFHVRGTQRIFVGNGWEGIYRFPNTMNGCDAGVFMIRWRSANPNVHVESSLRELSEDNSATTKTGGFGYMYGTNCQQPMFKIASASDGATLVDIHYELKFWRAAP